jgi:uncharacterized membrane-anchored protein YhcB (DUF1043 family)
MSFWAFVAILAILGVMFGALYISKIADTRQKEEQQKRKHIRDLRNDLLDIDEIINTLFIYDRNPELISTLSRKMMSLIQEGLKLLPGDEQLLRDLTDIQQIESRVEALLAEPQDPEIPTSDRQIYILKKHFIKTIRFVRELQSVGEINELEASQHKSRLMKNALLLEVKAYRNHGEDARQRGEISSAANYLKHAKELLINSDLTFADKTDQIKAVSREISGLYVTLPDHPEK